MVQFPWKLVRQVLQKANIELPFDPSILLHTTYPRELKHVTTQKLTHECLCCRWNPKVETTQLCISWWIDKSNVLHPHDGIIFGHEDEWRTDSCCNRTNCERSRTQWSWSVFSIYRNVQNRQVRVVRTQVGGCRGEEGMGQEFPCRVIKTF